MDLTQETWKFGKCFHVGDRVIVRSDLKVDKIYDVYGSDRGLSVTPGMGELFGREFTIKYTTMNGAVCYLEEDDNGWAWTSEMLIGIEKDYECFDHVDFEEIALLL